MSDGQPRDEVSRERTRGTDMMDPVIEHELDPCVGEHPQQRSQVTLKKTFDSVRGVDVADGQVEAFERA